MLNSEDIIRKILSQRPDLTKEVVLRMVRQKREGAGRLLTNEGAAHMVANDLGIDVVGGDLKTTLSLKDLIVGTSDVTVTGKVLITYPTQTFSRRNGAMGRVGRFVLQDETSSVNIVLWDEKAEILDRRVITQGMTVRVNHGYVRAGLNGRPEVNVGQRGSIVPLSPASEQAKTMTQENLKKIKDISLNDFFVSFLGVVTEVSPTSAFTRSDGKNGKVARLRLGDETGRIRVVFWDDKTEIAENLVKGDALKVVNGRTRIGLGSEVEVHTTQTSEVVRLETVPTGLGIPKLTLRKMQDLIPRLSSVDVIARIVNIGQVRVFDRPSGGQGRVGDVTLMDETGFIRLSLWDEKADVLGKLSAGDIVLLEGAYTREGLGGSVNLNLGRLGTLTVNPSIEEAKNLPPYSREITPLAQLREGQHVSVEGIVAEVPSTRQVTTRDGRDLMVVSLRLRDDTGETRVSFWRDNAIKAQTLMVGARVRIRDAFVRTGFDGDLELSTRSITQLEILEQVGGGMEPLVSSEGTVSAIKEEEYYEGEARIAGLLDCEVQAVCPICKDKVDEVEDGAFVCHQCGDVLEPDRTLIVTAEMEDENGRFNALFHDELAERLLGMKVDYAWNLIAQSEDEAAPLKLTERKLVGQRLRLSGEVVEQSARSFKVQVKELKLV